MERGRVLVTGASGFIGRVLVPLLVGASYEVHAVHHDRAVQATSGASAHRVDLMDADAVEELVAAVAPSHLVHLAWYTTHGLYWSSERNLDWLAASATLLRSFAAHGGRRAVLAGTCAEYDLTDGVCSETATARRPSSLYGVCKNALQEVAASHAATAGYSIAWARLFYAYGPAEPPERLVPTVIRGILESEPVELSHGHQRRDFLFVDDVAAALAQLLASDVEGPVNIGSGSALSIRDVVAAIVDRLGNPPAVRYGARDLAADDPPLIVAETTRLREEVRWEPATTLREGIDRAAAWWRACLAVTR